MSRGTYHIMNRYINTTAHNGQLVHRLEMESSKFLTFSLSFPFCEMTTWSVYAFSVSELERERDCWTSSTVIRYFKEIRHNNKWCLFQKMWIWWILYFKKPNLKCLYHFFLVYGNCWNFDRWWLFIQAFQKIIIWYCCLKFYE